MRNPFRRKVAPAPAAPALRANAVASWEPSTHKTESLATVQERLATKLKKAMPVIHHDGTAQDDSAGTNSLKRAYQLGYEDVPEALLAWYGSQTFLGHHLCAILAQHWLIDKACTMPAKDAIRHWFQMTVAGIDDGEKAEKAVEALERADKKYRLKNHLREFVRQGRVFGIRIAYFAVESTDPAYYEKPFNPDGITPGSYKGIRQVDPYWCAPILDEQAAANPSSANFYEPTWWLIDGRKYHRTHLVIFKTSEVADLLKPAYMYGGIPLPQKIMERVYAAERSANEAPQLAMTKRTMVWTTDLAEILVNQEKFRGLMGDWIGWRDNYGVKLNQEGDTMEQFDTSLTDLDALIMTQYQICAAIAGVPATKLMGTTPKGFNSSGDYETKSYHEELESIQADDLGPLIERHHEMVIRSEIQPWLKFDLDEFDITIDWAAVDSPTAKEYAEINKLNSETDNNYVNAGAIDGMDIRTRLRDDPNSGYTDLPDIEPDDLTPPPGTASPSTEPNEKDGKETDPAAPNKKA